MVWAYLSGINNAEGTQEEFRRDEFRRVNYVFGTPQFGTATIPTPAETADLKKEARTKAAAKLKEAKAAKVMRARQDASQKVNGRISARVRQLRRIAETKTQE